MAYDLIKISALPETTPDESQDIVIGDRDYAKRIKYGDVKADMVGTSPSYTTDTEPYLMRKTAHTGVVGKCALNKLVGGSLGWNQLNVNDRTSGSANGITATKDSSGTWTLSGTATATALINPVTTSTFDLVANHVMYLGGCPSGGTTNTYQLDVRKSGVIVTGAIDVGNGNLFKVVESGAHSINMRVASGTTVNNIKYAPQLIDLTQMFGSTIADYVYSLGSTNGIAWLSKYIDLGTYHAYYAGSIQSVQPTAHVTTGKNLLDVTNEASGSNAQQLEFGSTATAYEPYTAHTYPLGSDTLRGYPMLVNNKLAFDGDEKTPDGTIRRKYNTYTATTCTSVGTTTAFGNYAVITNFSDADTTSGVYTPLVCDKYLGVATSGERAPMTTYIVGGGLVIVDPSFTDLATARSILASKTPQIVYKTITQTTESSTAFQRVQTVDADGTESFTTSSPVPVGHETQTPDNILAALGWLGE